MSSVTEHNNFLYRLDLLDAAVKKIGEQLEKQGAQLDKFDAQLDKFDAQQGAQLDRLDAQLTRQSTYWQPRVWTRS